MYCSMCMTAYKNAAHVSCLQNSSKYMAQDNQNHMSDLIFRIPFAPKCRLVTLLITESASMHNSYVPAFMQFL
jgi:hypothetical protein